MDEVGNSHGFLKIGDAMHFYERVEIKFPSEVEFIREIYIQLNTERVLTNKYTENPSSPYPSSPKTHSPPQLHDDPQQPAHDHASCSPNGTSRRMQR